MLLYEWMQRRRQIIDVVEPAQMNGNGKAITTIIRTETRTTRVSIFTTTISVDVQKSMRKSVY
jgi:hypothetical protein